MTLRLAISPCPNDTFLFCGLASGAVPLEPPEPIETELCDIDLLNRRARAGAADVVKVSYAVVPSLLDRYVLLSSGGALGRGCGPLLVARDGVSEGPIAIPGTETTAFLLLQLWNPATGPFRVMPFHEIPGAVVRGEVAAGLLIHESRFTYQAMGLRLLVDLGVWWEAETALPLPLGAIVARRELGAARLADLERAIVASAGWAREHPGATRTYVRAHAQELEERVIEAHIALYVNDFSLDLGGEGRAAVRTLFERAARAGLTPPVHAFE